jgi:hypothetical protein
MTPTALSPITPYGLGWTETMSIRIGGDPKRTICLQNSFVPGTCDGDYHIWVKKGANPWVQYGDPIVLAGTQQAHAMENLEGINCFDRLYVSAGKFSQADFWFMTTSGNQGYE